jgi:hypothetical protein
MSVPSAQLAPGVDWPWLQSAAQVAWRTCRPWPPELGDGWTTAPKVATRTPAPDTRSIAAARSFAAATASRWGVPNADDVTAVVAELLANALRHGVTQARLHGRPLPSWPIRLGLLYPGSWVICAVTDPSPDVPALREPDWLAESGRGLHVVAALAQRWGYCLAPADRGKVVWAAIQSR